MTALRAHRLLVQLLVAHWRVRPRLKLAKSLLKRRDEMARAVRTGAEVRYRDDFGNWVFLPSGDFYGAQLNPYGSSSAVQKWGAVEVNNRGIGHFAASSNNANRANLNQWAASAKGNGS